jgi:hypothetical protein
MVVCPLEGSVRMADGESDKLHSSQICIEGRDEGGVFGRLRPDLVVASEVSAKADFDENEGAAVLNVGGRVWRGGVRDTPSIDEFRRRAVAGGK